MNRMGQSKVTPGFKPLDVEASTYLLDTNAWSEIASSPKAVKGFLPWLTSNRAIAALSIFGVFELSRASNRLASIDELLTSASSRVYLPMLYDELHDLEMSVYPKKPEMLWSPISTFRDQSGVRFVEQISNDDRFVSKREEFLDFGRLRFMSLKDYKQNFPLGNDGVYSPDDAELFSWATTLDFLLRHFPGFLLPYKGKLRTFDTTKLCSLHVRSLFLYFKYYVHAQSPTDSDFLDFAHVSYLPYVDVFVTERNVLNVLSHMKSTGHEPQDCRVIHVAEFTKEVEEADD